MSSSTFEERRMPVLVRGKQFHEVWEETLHLLLKQPEHAIAPRGQRTQEILAANLWVEDLRSNILVNTGRDLNYRFMVAEFLWIALGLNDVNVIARYNSRMREFSDDGETLYGAYGKRLHMQWPNLLEKFKRDLASRQGVAIIFDSQDTFQATKDVPCTIGLQFLVRDYKLNCIATMRSSDIWLGLPYDVYTFSQLAICMASELGVNTGWLNLNLGSVHLYEENLERAREAESDWKSYTLRSPLRHGFPGQRLEQVLRDPRLSISGSHQDDCVLADVLRAPKKIDALGVLKNAYEAPAHT